MSKAKSIIITVLLCLSFFTTELLALDSNESNTEIQKSSFSLDGIFKSFDGTVKGLSKSLDGTVKGLGKSLDGAVDGVGEALDGTLEGIGEFIEENGEAVLFIGTMFAVLISDADSHHNNYGNYNGYSSYSNYGHNHYGYYNSNYCYNRW